MAEDKEKAKADLQKTVISADASESELSESDAERVTGGALCCSMTKVSCGSITACALHDD